MLLTISVLRTHPLQPLGFRLGSVPFQASLQPNLSRAFNPNSICQERPELSPGGGDALQDQNRSFDRVPLSQRPLHPIVSLIATRLAPRQGP